MGREPRTHAARSPLPRRENAARIGNHGMGRRARARRDAGGLPRRNGDPRAAAAAEHDIVMSRCTAASRCGPAIAS